jgi:hypothetical protein
LRDGGQQYIDQENTSATWFADAIDKNALFDTRNLVLERLVNMNWFQQNWVWAGDQGMFILACVIHSFYVSPGSNFLPWANRVSQAVQDNLLDGDKVLHDPPLPDLYCGFSVDYATGKGVLLRCLSEWAEIGSDVKPPDYLSEFILNNAAHVWNNRLYKNDTNPSDPTKKYQFGFNWNPSGKPPFAPEPPFPSGSNGSLFSQLVLQVSGMAALNAALNFAPNDEIPGS